MMFGFGKKSFNKFERGLLEHVEKAGCHINGVFDPDSGEPSFCYSVGFPKTVGQPEVIIFGLDMSMMGHMINDVLTQCREGLILRDGLAISGLLDGFDCIARQVVSERIEAEYFNSAIWYSETLLEREMTEAFQIVWPGSRDFLYPWDEGVEPSVIESQPALYEKK